MYSESKRPRLSGQHQQAGGRRTPPQTEPSKVVFVGDLLANTTERDVQQAMQQYGQIASVTMIPRNRQALVEFEQLCDAEALIDRCKSGRRVLLRDSPVVVNYSRSAQINEPRKEYKSGAPTSLLLLTLFRLGAEVDADTFRRIGSPFGRLLRVSVLRGRSLQAVLEFASVEEASRAKPLLNGADIYANCNTLRCEFVTRRVHDLLPMEGCSLVQEWPETAAAAGVPAGQRGGGSGRVRDGGSLLDSVDVGGGGGGGPDAFDRRRKSPMDHQYQHQYLQPQPQPQHYHRDADYQSGDSWRQSSGRSSSSRYPPLPPMSLPPPQLPPPPPQHPAAAADRDASGCILHVSGLSDRVNCSRLFNLLCLYGNVRRVKFFASKRGQALVEMMDRQSAMQCVSFLHDECLLGSRVLLEMSRQTSIRSVREAVNLPDGTPSIAEFDSQRRSLNRFLSDQSARKNPPMKPGRVVYFWGYPSQGSEADLRRQLLSEGAPEPPVEGGVEFFSGDHRSGLLRYEATEDALAAICLANHSLCQAAGGGDRGGMLKMCFSVTTGARRRGFQPQQPPPQQQQDQSAATGSAFDADDDGGGRGRRSMEDSEGSESH